MGHGLLAGVCVGLPWCPGGCGGTQGDAAVPRATWLGCCSTTTLHSHEQTCVDYTHFFPLSSSPRESSAQTVGGDMGPCLTVQIIKG